jgi:hypothetical protein
MVSKAFITAGRAVFTVSNPAGERYTYRVQKSGDESRPAAWFVSLLTGPDNRHDYTYLGMLNPADGAVRLTRASRYTDDSVPVRVIRWAVRLAWNGRDLPEGYKVHHEGRCGRCARALTVPASIESGFGPECISKV